MIKLERILLPTDFSEQSREPQKYACSLADQFNSEIHVLHVIEEMAAIMTDPEVTLALPADYVQQYEQQTEKALGEWLPADWAAGKSIVRATRTGTPFVEIVRYARENNIDLIVLGTHGRSGLAHVLMGSVAERVVQKARCPVLTVHPEGHQFVMP